MMSKPPAHVPWLTRFSVERPWLIGTIITGLFVTQISHEWVVASANPSSEGVRSFTALSDVEGLSSFWRLPLAVLKRW